MTERELNSPEDVRRHLRGLHTRRPEDDASLRKWLAAKRVTWVVLLAFAVLMLYLLDQLVNALKLAG
jgi:hypothetical protein